MLEKFKQYLDNEYHETKTALTKDWCTNKEDAVWYAIQRCLGVAQFVTMIDDSIPFAIVESLYTEYMEALSELLIEEER